MEDTIVIKPVPTKQPRDLDATSRYMADRDHDGAKVPLDENRHSLSGSLNCVSDDRDGQLDEMKTLLRLHGNPRSTQAAQHCVLSYPKGVRPTRAQIERDLRINMKKQGMEDHLLIWDAHDNTDNFHVHFLLCRVVPHGKNDKYPLANNGLVKVTRKDKRGNVRTRTDEAACRQAAIAEINELYGYGTDGLTHDKDGKPQLLQKQKDPHSDKTRAGERKTGKKSKERQLSGIAKQVFDLSKSWHECDQVFASFAIEMTFKMDGTKIVGGKLTGPDGRQCKFSTCGSDYSYPALEKRFGTPVPSDAACINEFHLEPFEYQDLLTPQEVKKRLLPVFKDAKDWPTLSTGIQHQGMCLERSGGGLIVRFNDSNDAIKCSEISNKFSLSKLEKVLGPCPLPKAALQPSARELLIRDAAAIFKKHVAQGHGLYWMDIDLSHANISIQKKPFINNVGERQNYWAVVRDDVSIPLSAILKTPDGNPVYTMWMLERLDARDSTVQKSKRIAQQKMQFEEIQKRCSVGGDLYQKYIADEYQYKKEKIQKLTFFGAIAKFFKLKNMENQDVYQDSSNNDKGQDDIRNASHSKQVFSM